MLIGLRTCIVNRFVWQRYRSGRGIAGVLGTGEFNLCEGSIFGVGTNFDFGVLDLDFLGNSVDEDGVNRTVGLYLSRAEIFVRRYWSASS